MKSKLVSWGPGLSFLAPAVLLFLVFVVYPIVFNVQASLLEWDGVNQGIFVGLDNYSKLAADPVFAITLRNSALWILLTIVPQAVIGLLLALALNQKIRGSTIYRSLFFLPAVLSPVVVGISWQRIMDPFNGVISSFGKWLNIEALQANFLSNPDTAIYTLILINVWMWTGFSMLFYLAGLQLIDPNLFEAAKIDGASWWQTTTRIVIPLLRNTHLSLLLLGIIGSLKTFELIYVMTEGGPNHASEMLPTYAFLNAFKLQSTGYASTISVVLIFIAITASVVLMRIFGAGFMTGSDKKS